jgi:dolichol-phosphate mannosyltransferase
LSERADVSVIIPTYNEYQNILHLVEVIKRKLPGGLFTEIIIVDDNSPDGTGKLIENHIQKNQVPRNGHLFQHHEDGDKLTVQSGNSVVKLIRRESKKGLASAVMHGIRSSTGQYILVMDADFSHPPEAVPVLITELMSDPNCIVIASRYTDGGSVEGWPFKRLLLSRLAAKIARYGLKLRDIRDPISGFFAFPRYIIENIGISSSGYKLLLEILVKTKGARVKEVPYAFTNRKLGESKLDSHIIFDYLWAIWYLYRYGRKSRESTKTEREKRTSVLFLSKAARFYTVGATGLLINYVVSILLSKGIISDFWYVQASVVGIFVSVSSNFILNKIWTFEDRNVITKNTLKQYGFFVGLSAVGAVIQLTLLYVFVESGFQYAFSLVLAVASASISNFLLNKKWTFHEKIWG